MGTIKAPVLVKLIGAITFSPAIQLKQILDDLKANIAPVELSSDIYEFTHTVYYTKEMGSGLKKVYLSFKGLIFAEQISDIKILTNLMEKQWSKEGKRRVNIDPGYLEKAKLILVTTKNYSHRIYLGSGIYGDVQLRMKGGTFQALDWTYPDYRMPEVIHFFRRVRDRYCKEVDKWAIKTKE